MQAPPDGTVDRDAAVRESAAARPPLDPLLLARGRERYGIYCAACHGIDGRGAGVVVQRGFPAPRSFLAGGDLSSAHLFDVIGSGKGVMYGFADRVPPRDRWAIAAYVQTLARAQGGAGGR
jgi:mono/diheme cytochrome c family protein